MASNLGLTVTARKNRWFPILAFWAKIKCCFDNSDENVHNQAMKVVERGMDIRINGEKVR
jgi:hypothetical protein